VTQKALRDVAASVRQRLLNRSRERGEDFQLTLIYFALERLMYRLSRSAYRDRFILKGAMLFSVWSETPHRATRDLDLLGRGDHEVSALIREFQEICRAPVKNDGVTFLPESIAGEEIREGDEYQAIRLSFEARLGVARIPIQVDIGFGDAVLPKPELLDYPTLLDFPAPRLLAYPRETVIAEKFQSMVELGIANSRMKDFFDLWYLAGHFEFHGDPLSKAMRAMFERRKTSLPSMLPLCLTQEFSGNRDKQAQWIGFLKRARLRMEELTFDQVLPQLEESWSTSRPSHHGAR
jgi:hypothetical protein